MRRLSLIDHLEIYLVAGCFALPVASSVTAERFPCGFDLAGPVDRCTVGVRWKAEFGLAGRFDCSVDKCPPPGPDLLTRDFAASLHLSVWSEVLAGSAVVPLSLARRLGEKPDSGLVSSYVSPSFVRTGREEALATAPMTVCSSGLGTVAEAPRKGPCG